MAKKNSSILLLLEIYDQAYDVRAWHGSNLKGSLKGLKLKELLFRPRSNRHNIWEIALHCAYWKYIVYRRLVNGVKNDFPRKPSNFPGYPTDPSINDWKIDAALLNDYHLKLRSAIETFPAKKLYTCPEDSKVSHIQTIYGAASHDLYHAGQIQLIKRFVRQSEK